MANEQNLKPWRPGQSGNPAGKPKGTKHLSTRIQELMNDENFEAKIYDSRMGYDEYKGVPLDAIIYVTINKAVNGDERAREWLAKYGWGQKYKIEATSEINVGKREENLAEEFLTWFKQKASEAPSSSS